jgi:hypothetical protein
MIYKYISNKICATLMAPSQKWHVGLERMGGTYK